MFLKVKEITSFGCSVVGDVDHGFNTSSIHEKSISTDQVREIQKMEECDYITLDFGDKKMDIAHSEDDFRLAMKKNDESYLVDNFDENCWKEYKKKNDYGC